MGEFQHEKQELQKVIEEQKIQLQKGDTPDVEKIRKELEKAQKEVKEGAVERERFQSQLEMLVQELEQKQMDLHEASLRQPSQGNNSAEVNNLRKQLEEI